MKIVCIDNKKIVCIDNKWFTYHFTIGKVYDVIQIVKPYTAALEEEYIYKIKDDVGITRDVEFPKFTTIESYRNDKIEIILNEGDMY
jgi:hypothetical protein